MNTEEQGKETAKVLKSFETSVAKLTAIVKGKDGLKPIRKIKKDKTSDLIDELFKEERESIEKEVKTELKELLKNYVTLNNTLQAERKKLNDIEIQKKKEFNTASAKLFNKIEGVDDILADYTSAFVAASENNKEDSK